MSQPVCHNRLRYDYNVKDALEDLQIAIDRAKAQRNTEPSRHGRLGWAIPRKW